MKQEEIDQSHGWYGIVDCSTQAEERLYGNVARECFKKLSSLEIGPLNRGGNNACGEGSLLAMVYSTIPG
jgi:hypothetical protein